MSRRSYIGLIGVALASRLVNLLWLHPLNWDEVEFYRASDWVAQGLVPFRDFWEHHTPLQWFLFAPVAAIVRGDGVMPVVAMRLAQLPLWIATFVLLFRWMKQRDIGERGRWSAILLAICSSMLMLPAVEFRVDALGCFLIALALAMLDERPMLAGAAIALTGFANIRFGPMLAFAMLMIVVARRRRALPVIAGAAAATAVCVAYFIATHSAAIAWKSVWVDNYYNESHTIPAGPMLLHRFASPFGYRVYGSAFSLSSVDPAAIAILVLGAIGLVRALRPRDPLFPLALLQLVNLLFIAKMNFIFNYHLMLVVIFAVPFVARELERIPNPRVVVALLLLVSGVNVYAAIFRGKEADFAYQDTIMRALDEVTPPHATVFDGTGWAIHRKPAQRYWMLRFVVTNLERQGYFPRYGAHEMSLAPPGAIVTDYAARSWFRTHPDLAQYVRAHYTPTWRDLWVPGTRATIVPRQSIVWEAPVAGAYTLHAPPNVVWSGGEGTLRAGDRVTIVNESDRPASVALVPLGVSPVYRQPPPGVDIDGSPLPVTHVPDLTWRSRKRSSSTATAF
jgi:uncharacterized membrane protein